VILMTAEFASN